MVHLSPSSAHIRELCSSFTEEQSSSKSDKVNAKCGFGRGRRLRGCVSMGVLKAIQGSIVGK